VPSNIAEGYGRRSRADYVHFLDIARGSANEVETQLLLAIQLKFASDAQVQQAMELVTEVQRILKGLVVALEASDRQNVKGSKQQ
jgi:four helix bundle protein